MIQKPAKAGFCFAWPPKLLVMCITKQFEDEDGENLSWNIYNLSEKRIRGFDDLFCEGRQEKRKRVVSCVDHRSRCLILIEEMVLFWESLFFFLLAQTPSKVKRRGLYLLPGFLTFVRQCSNQDEISLSSQYANNIQIKRLEFFLEKKHSQIYT